MNEKLAEGRQSPTRSKFCSSCRREHSRTVFRCISFCCCGGWTLTDDSRRLLTHLVCATLRFEKQVWATHPHTHETDFRDTDRKGFLLSVSTLRISIFDICMWEARLPSRWQQHKREWQQASIAPPTAKHNVFSSDLRLPPTASEKRTARTSTRNGFDKRSPPRYEYVPGLVFLSTGREGCHEARV